MAIAVRERSVLNTVTQNYSRAVKGAGFIVDATVTIGYDTPWRQVEAMLVEAAHRCKGILTEPPPRVFQVALSDFYIEYRLVCQAEAEEPRPRAELMSNLHAAIVDAFNENGVQIMSPHYLGDPRDPKVVPPAEWYAAPAVPSGQSGRKAGLIDGDGWGAPHSPICNSVPCSRACRMDARKIRAPIAK